ncbi:hypothetical protein CEN44_02700 [Fischerella muscicola CCMEE 5323]|uniref:Uncharacterized protein n=2 Tax=Fischerella muscicola TaxID=92938 RepID=A0A2N6K851_FISMU|nr:hypothetical protein CEN44_02700 [Fischerella muscicola CCMEE 5323]
MKVQVHQLESIGSMEEDLEFSESSKTEITESNTLYKAAFAAMQEYIEVYLSLSKQSDGFSNIQNLDLISRDNRNISYRRDDGRLVVKFLDAHIVNCSVQFDGQNPVRYI